MKKNFRRKKRALYLIIEIIAVLIISVGLTVGTIKIVAIAVRVYKIHKHSVDISNISEGLIQYKQVNGTYAGDTPAAKLTGAAAGNTFLLADIAALPATATGQGYVADEVASIVFRELYLGKFISFNINIAESASATAKLYDLVSKTFLPTSSIDDSLAFFVTSANNSSIGSLATGGPNPSPKIYLFRYGQMTTAAKLTFGGSGNVGQAGALAATVASELDLKIDDGKCNFGNLLANNPATGAATLCCDTANLTGTGYTSNSSDNGSNGCIMEFLTPVV
ncbi:hypothetical protein [Candidatus Deianiraea vastatrix]|uniref:Uncharacterized protein n=1 Tax=Candidatus Deianiraea vastatrix TaxID=2163644 RepID=A0A5B8XF31_9RICK|nr:hypothetical protein [Candidatus Deianiraea vastatrix]QED23515.1 hypothetical protein Deia_00724 [Candidatus Deianiraea vastatrix]